MVRVALLLVGLWAGFVGMLVHRQSVLAGGIVWPWGLVMVLVVTAVVVRAASGVHRLGAAWFALGWGLALVLERVIGKDSYLVATDWVGWTFMVVTIGVIGLEMVRRPRLGG